MSLDETFREHEGDDCLDWLDESDHEEGYIEPIDDADTVRLPVTALSAFSLSTWLSR